jgi:alpha-L-rhamnosidase
LEAYDRSKTHTARLRRDFTVKPGLKRAVLHVCGLGHYALEVNGKEAEEGRPLTPGWTDYEDTLLYDTLDITPFLPTAGILWE